MPPEYEASGPRLTRIGTLLYSGDQVDMTRVSPTNKGIWFWTGSHPYLSCIKA
jgi:hypothetical protein